MKQILDTLQQHKATFVVSLFSAIVAVILQLTITSLISNDASNDMQNIYLEDAKGFIMVPDNNTNVVTQGSNILQDEQLAVLQVERVVEDERVKAHIPKQEFKITNLVVGLDAKGSTGTTENMTKNIAMQIPNTNHSLSLCGDSNRSNTSCTTYLVNKAAQSIPVQVNLVGGQVVSETAMNIQYPQETLTYTGSFIGKPVELDIRPF